MKIKWNDDRVKEAGRAILLIGRERLARGESEGLIRAALAEYRADPADYKAKKAAWPEAGELGPLKHPAQVAAYRDLQAKLERQMERMTRAKRQFNSLAELDNALVASLGEIGT